MGALGNRARVWHNGNVRRYLAVLLLGTGLVVATVYLNPTIVQFGRQETQTVDSVGEQCIRDRLSRVETVGQLLQDVQCSRDDAAVVRRKLFVAHNSNLNHTNA